MGVVFAFLYIFISVSIYSAQHTKRKIEKIDPHIKCGNTSIPLLHVTATKTGTSHDVIHYVFTTRDRPTIIIKHVMKQEKLKFNNENICNRNGTSFTFSGDDVSELSGLIVSKVFAYNDDNDDISLHGGSQKIGVDIASSFDWKYSESNSEDVVFIGHNGNSTISFTMNVHEEYGHGKKQPKNPINANLTEFRLEMSNMHLPYMKTRYAIEVVFFGTAASIDDDGKTSGKEAAHTTTQYIDDEYTPGIFEIWSVNLLPSLPSIRRTYVTWKPVSYHNNTWARSSQGLVNKFVWKNGVPVKKLQNPLSRYSGAPLPWTLVSGGMATKYYGINVTFGLPKDGFFNHHNYLSWSGMVGCGSPPIDSMSLKIILTIVIGLGTPGVVILGGIVFLLIRKIKTSAESSYDAIH